MDPRVILGEIRRSEASVCAGGANVTVPLRTLAVADFACVLVSAALWCVGRSSFGVPTQIKQVLFLDTEGFRRDV